MPILIEYRMVFYLKIELLCNGFRALMCHHLLNILTGSKMNQAAQHDINLLQTLDTDLLAKAARGEVDLNTLARFVLSQRGQDSDGKWIGFNDAAKHHQISV